MNMAPKGANIADEEMTKGIYEPDDLSAMQHLFVEITHQAWFSRDPRAKKSFAKYLLETYSADSFDPDTHRASIEAYARAYYPRER